MTRIQTKKGYTAQVAWRRVVLDEAHSIKDRRCSTARAVFALNSKYKWALSGTPLQARCLPPLSGVLTLLLEPRNTVWIE